MHKIDEVIIPPRTAGCFEVPAGGVFRIASIEGPQVGDLNLGTGMTFRNGSIPARRGRCMAAM